MMKSMGLKGRITTTLLVSTLNLLYITHYYLRDGFVAQIEFIGLPVMIMLAWWFGKQYDVVKYYSEKDTLTKLYNRRYIDTFISKLERNGGEFAIVLLDLNDFKIINDIYGHKAGDHYLKSIASQLENTAGKKEIVARWGGDEFIIIFPYTPKKRELGKRIEEIRQRLKNVSPNGLEIGVSIGTAIYPSEGKTFDELLKAADQNMYKDKAQKNKIIGR
ncbi:GGDEF domain-containing protein [Mesobacillus maritimus]|uniref:GGDEF domain-containing protein n=1 Tax=Mesobacillus maritimus TaxID=1643336 RepID=UPI00384FADE7